jgi:hypothetical protein
MRISDAAWACIEQAHGHVQGKSFYMRKETLTDILWERNDPQHYQTHGRRLYGVRVVIDPLMKRGEVRLR